MPFWLVPLTENKILYRSVPIAVCRCLVEKQFYPSGGFSSVDYFRRLSMLPSFQPLSGNSLKAFLHHTAWHRFLKSKSHLPVKFSWFYLMFLLILWILLVANLISVKTLTWKWHRYSCFWVDYKENQS